MTRDQQIQDVPYITAWSALNIPLPDGDLADWHTEGMLRSGKLIVAGLNGYTGAPGLEDGDLRDITFFINQRGLQWPTHYCATTERAILDMVYRGAFVHNSPAWHIELDDLLIDVDREQLARRIRPWFAEATPRQQQCLCEWMYANGVGDEEPYDPD